MTSKFGLSNTDNANAAASWSGKAVCGSGGSGRSDDTFGIPSATRRTFSSTVLQASLASIVTLRVAMYVARFLQPTSNAKVGLAIISLSGIVVAINDITFLILEKRVASAAWLAP